MRLSRLPFSKYFHILYAFAQIFKYFALFCLFLSFFWKIARISLLSRIGPEKFKKKKKKKKNADVLLKVRKVHWKRGVVGFCFGKIIATHKEWQRLLSAFVRMWTNSHKICKVWALINQVFTGCFPFYRVWLTSQIIRSVWISKSVDINQLMWMNQFCPIEVLNLIIIFNSREKSLLLGIWNSRVKNPSYALWRHKTNLSQIVTP